MIVVPSSMTLVTEELPPPTCARSRIIAMP